MQKLTREEAKKAGYTHLATHTHDGGKHFKKGDTVLCKYNEKTGEYSTGGLCCLLSPDENYTLEEL